jgi:hypothetical protein
MKKIISTFIVLTLISFSGCDIKSPVEGVKLILNTEIAETSVTIAFKDAATGSLIGFDDFKKVNINIEGRNKNDVVDLVLLPETFFQSDKGFVSFAFRNEAVFPLDIVIVARTENYLSTSIPLSIDRKGTSAIEIKMIDINNPPQGVTVIRTYSAFAGSNGELTNDHVVQTPPDLSGGTGGFSSINFPKGTILRTQSGNPLTGNLITTLAYFNNRSESSLSAFPGTLNPEVNISGARQRASFYTGGFAALEILDFGGNEAKNISNGSPAITIQIPNPTFNFDAGRNVEAGDNIPVWSYDINIGEWLLEEAGEIVMASNNNFEVTHTLSHLSYFNLDWFSTDICSQSLGINIMTDQCSSVSLKLNVYRIINGQEYFMKTVYVSAQQSNIRFLNSPPGPARIRAFFNQSVPAGILDIPDLCASGEINFNINTGSTLHNIHANVRGFCPNNPNIEIRPTIPVWYRPAGTNEWSFMGNMIQGNLEILCFPFGIFDIGGYFDDEFVIAYGININSTNIVIDYPLPASSCN